MTKKVHKKIIGKKSRKLTREEWWVDGKKEREHKIKYFDNKTIQLEQWLLDGQLHRADGPAAVSYKEDGSILFQIWYLNGKFHRDDGPAMVFPDWEGESWWVNGLNKAK